MPGSGRQRRAAEARAGQLLERGQQAVLAGELDTAVSDLHEAGGLARQLLADAPGDERLLRGLGSVLYSLGAALTGRGDSAESAAVLAEAEDAYRKVAAPDAALLLADVRLRRATSLALSGAGASAVTEAQSAVLTYIRRSSPDRVDEAYLGLARSLMLASDVFGAFADPVTALAAAQQGLSWVVRAANDGRRDLLDPATRMAMVRALSVELALLRTLGREQEQGNAAGLLAFLGAEVTPTLTQDRLAAVACRPPAAGWTAPCARCCWSPAATTGWRSC